MRNAETATPTRRAATPTRWAATPTRWAASPRPDGAGAADPAGTRVVGGAASTAVRGLLLAPAHEAEVLAAFEHAAYLAIGADIVAVVDDAAAALPNAVRVADPAVLRALGAGAPAAVGDGRVRCGEVSVRVGRWWGARPRLARVEAPALAAGTALLPPHPPGLPAAAEPSLADLAAAAQRGDAGAAATAAASLVGVGAGLTPAGDDVVAGALVTWAALASCAPAPGGPPRAAPGRAAPAAGPRWRARVAAVATAVADAATRDARARTTRVSAALLTHAAQGEASQPVAAVLRALAGTGDLTRAAAALAGVGATSGRDLLAGVRLAATAVVHHQGAATPGPSQRHREEGP